MKYALSLVFIVSVLLTSCNTLSNRRDLFSPNKANGPWNRKLAEMTPPPPPPPALQPLHQIPTPLPAPVLKPLH